MKKILIISHDRIGAQMAGPGIRYHYMAEILSKAGFDVTMGFFSPEYMPEESFERSYDVESVNVHHFEEAFAKADAVVALWVSEAIIDFCNAQGIILVFDIYAPVPVESLAVKIFAQQLPSENDEFVHEASIKDYRNFLANGDAFLYSNRRQLDFWLGFIFGAGLTSPKQYLHRNAFNQFIKAPMGIDTRSQPKVHKSLYKGVVKGIAVDDIVMVWSGGIYDWYDGVILMEAMRLVRTMDKRIKMVFPAIVHPNKNTPKWKETVDTQAKADELGLTGKNVFFFHKWINYYDRGSFLADADIAVYTHKLSIESEFSHRTRVIDSHIMFCLPTIATEGDHFADIIAESNLGRVVPPGNKEALANAIVDLAKKHNLHEARKNLEHIRPQYDWQETLAPLVQYLKSDPTKFPQVKPLVRAPLHNRKLGFAKRHTPVIVKKAVVKVLPTSVRKKLLGT